MVSSEGARGHPGDTALFFLIVAQEDFQARRFGQGAAHRGQRGCLAQQHPQIRRRHHRGARGNIQPARERQQGPEDQDAEVGSNICPYDQTLGRWFTLKFWPKPPIKGWSCSIPDQIGQPKTHEYIPAGRKGCRASQNKLASGCPAAMLLIKPNGIANS